MSKNKNVGYVHTLKTGAWTSQRIQQNKNERGSNATKLGALIFGFLLVVGLETVFVYVALAILRNAEVITLSPAVYQITVFSVVTVLWRGFHRAVFLGALASRQGRATTS